jgi:hypothetical protein
VAAWVPDMFRKFYSMEKEMLITQQPVKLEKNKNSFGF